MNPALRQLMRMIKQQFWLFGWDVRRPEGNLLVQMGFDRTPGPEGGRIKSSRYHRALDDGTWVTLWSFGMCWSSAEEGSIFLSRIRPKPLYCPKSSFVPEVWDPAHLRAFHSPKSLPEREASQRMALEVLRWFGRYEADVLAMCGPAYRQQAVDAWRDPVGTADQLVSHWQGCCDDFSALVAASPRVGA